MLCLPPGRIPASPSSLQNLWEARLGDVCSSVRGADVGGEMLQEERNISLKLHKAASFGTCLHQPKGGPELPREVGSRGARGSLRPSEQQGRAMV